MAKSVFTDEYRAFCAVLMAIRRNAGLTQQQVADRLKKPQSFVAKCERGERRLDVVEFLAYARALGTDPCEVLKKIGR